MHNAALRGLVAFGLAGTFSGAGPVRSFAGFALTAFGALVGALLVMRVEDLAEFFGSGRPAPARRAR